MKKVYKEFCFKESFKTKKEAQKRKSEVEHEIDTGTFIPPASVKIKDFLVDFVDMYGKRKWGLSMYTSNTGLIRNYINPVLGQVYVVPTTIDGLYTNLLHFPSSGDMYF